MGIQVVHDEYALVTIRVTDIHKIPALLSPVNRSTVFPDTYMPHATQRLHEYKYAAGTAAHILGINLPNIGYSCAMKSHFRKSGNQMSGKWKSSSASLLA